MEFALRQSKLIIWLRELRAPFFTATIVPLLVGSALAYASAGVFNPGLFVLALLAMLLLHAGANMANDYFDHKSGNDWANRNVTPFSGGSRLIQQGLIRPQAVLTAAQLTFRAAAAVGLVIVIITQSAFILILGVIGLLGGYFYTAGPIRLGYRCAGELSIGLLFGLLPVYGAYYLQKPCFDLIPLLPGAIVGILIFLVILANEFPDLEADGQANKKTLVVIFGPGPAAQVYQACLIASYAIAGAAIFIAPQMLGAWLGYLLTLPIAVFAIKLARGRDLVKPGQYRLSQVTILLHLAGGIALAAGLLILGFYS